MPWSRNTDAAVGPSPGPTSTSTSRSAGEYLRALPIEVGDEPPEQAGVPQPDQMRSGLDRDPHAIARLRPERRDRVADDVVEADRLRIGVEGAHRDA